MGFGVIEWEYEFVSIFFRERKYVLYIYIYVECYFYIKEGVFEINKKFIYFKVLLMLIYGIFVIMNFFM